MKANVKSNSDSEKTAASIYISVDHLKQGDYQLHLMCKEKIIKTVIFKK